MGVTMNFGSMMSGRSIMASTLHDIAAKDERLFVLVADTGGAMKDFREEFPARFIDVGIAEQNCVGVAAGLALEGNVPVVSGMIPFLSMRALEQVRTDICYQNLPVRLIGTGGGLTSGGGSTHNAMEDIALMSSLVNMTVLSVGDPLMIKDILEMSMDYPGPMFIRMAQGRADAVIYEEGTVKFEIGKAIVANEGDDATIFCHGTMLRLSLELARDLKEEGINVRVVDMYSIKPLDKDTVIKCVKETKRVLCWEDHLMYGGLASAVADAMADAGVYPEVFKRMGIPQVYAGFGSGPEQQVKYSYDIDSAKKVVRAMVGK